MSGTGVRAAGNTTITVDGQTTSWFSEGTVRVVREGGDWKVCPD